MARTNNNRALSIIAYILLTLIVLIVGAIFGIWSYFEKKYTGRAYPNVYIDSVRFGGKSQSEIEAYWTEKNKTISNIQFTFQFENTIATVSASDLAVGYNAKLSAVQALLVGRSPNFLSNIRERYGGQQINLPPAFTWDTDRLDATVASLSATINIPVENALFQFAKGKVTAFKPSKAGKALNEQKLKETFSDEVIHAITTNTQRVIIPVPVDTIEPLMATNQTNTFGIKEKISTGYSEFAGSIPGRIHNVALAASKLNGILIAPGETFSFNKTVGDISAATGYQSAYIIKDGRTVLGDGGGVCQVSTTLFRAALNAGLPIIERHEHSYRVHYYEEGGFKPGLDATVFDPSNDLKFINDTPAYILIQTKTDTNKLTLTFDLYGVTDGRHAEILNQTLTGITAPPAPLYQDDPTLSVGVVKQVDFEAWGAKASFRYKVTKNRTTLIDQVFTSNYRPWQAVFLKGTKQ